MIRAAARLLLVAGLGLAATGCPRGGAAEPAPVELEWPDAGLASPPAPQAGPAVSSPDAGPPAAP